MLCENIAFKICKNSPQAISSAIKSINAGYIDGVNGFETEKKEFGKLQNLKFSIFSNLLASRHVLKGLGACCFFSDEVTGLTRFFSKSNLSAKRRANS